MIMILYKQYCKSGIPKWTFNLNEFLTWIDLLPVFASPYEMIWSAWPSCGNLLFLSPQLPVLKYQAEGTRYWYVVIFSLREVGVYFCNIFLFSIIMIIIFPKSWNATLNLLFKCEVWAKLLVWYLLVHVGVI